TLDSVKERESVHDEHEHNLFYRNPTIIPTLLTIFSSYGMVFFHSQDDIWDIYAPLDALSRVEEKALLPFEYASASHHYR
ncbi:hypothetical protein NECAME_19076, partial [Necator americanus]